MACLSFVVAIHLIFILVEPQLLGDLGDLNCDGWSQLSLSKDLVIDYHHLVVYRERINSLCNVDVIRHWFNDR